MSNVTPFPPKPDYTPPVLKSGGGDGTSGDMEHRVAHLEERVARVESKIDGISGILTDIRVELAKKPSTAALWAMVATVLAAALAIAFGTFAIAEWVASRAAG